ncbi:MAG: DNA polymerase III subunit delta' [Candidatus Kerfeldbacteria bacterium RIFCSPLOWO2_01_FULL_48_11]|uniref:DNA polymerase III subunit delta n=1 Tax=Candidatus Kerfeldbacteria bacterium RIFCSPLOWO2_01_FULL_48_11 TaxID=1798543 RepID=A0A1G2B1Z9_9BACT|nr:MAG: DNA polymerase III subunit delta' [Candidatus Kerfeldbacteria bacterium RIFCSPLOWO2_01_FULL_48_11]HCJ52674.1 DNA polymerase III subunit delta' [Candidatus Kerfeldbacteria bacterium]
MKKQWNCGIVTALLLLMQSQKAIDTTEFIGHRRIVDTFVKAHRAGKLSHAYLFDGPAHVGKWKVANVLASTMLCQRELYPPCGTCDTCRSITSGVHPDFLVAQSIEGSLITIEQIRAIRSRLALRPMVGNRTVVLIKEVERLTPGAANALLKTLEEPPGHTILILTSTHCESVIQTIISRCTVLHFYQVSKVEIAKFLTEKCSCTPQHAKEIALFSGGLPGRAIEYTLTPLVLETFRNDIGLLGELRRSSVNQRLRIVKETLGTQKKVIEQRDLVSRMLSAWQEALHLTARQVFLNDYQLPSSIKPVIMEMATHNSSHVVRFSQIFSKLQGFLSQNAQPNVILEYAALSL